MKKYLMLVHPECTLLDLSRIPYGFGIICIERVSSRSYKDLKFMLGSPHVSDNDFWRKEYVYIMEHPEFKEIPSILKFI